jgi:hypothetical protein
VGKAASDMRESDRKAKKAAEYEQVTLTPILSPEENLS